MLPGGPGRSRIIAATLFAERDNDGGRKIGLDPEVDLIHCGHRGWFDGQYGRGEFPLTNFVIESKRRLALAHVRRIASHAN
jgi:hypothetical protein